MAVIKKSTKIGALEFNLSEMNLKEETIKGSWRQTLDDMMSCCPRHSCGVEG